MECGFKCEERVLTEIHGDEDGLCGIGLTSGHRCGDGEYLAVFDDPKRQRQIIFTDAYAHTRCNHGMFDVDIPEFNFYALTFEEVAQGDGFVVGMYCYGNESV